MGRPLNKKFFGVGTADGNEMKVQFHNGTASVMGYIVKQTGSKRFLCSDGTVEKTCYLVDKASADIAAGEMSISVKGDDNTVYQVIKISAKVVTLDTGARMPWTFTTDAADGAAEMEEAGDDLAGTNDDDFEGDDV